MPNDAQPKAGSSRPASQPTTQSPNSAELKKLPPIKAAVGLARGPDLRNVKSKIGSLENVKHKPMGGEKRVESQKLEWKAKPRIGSMDNAKHKPLGGEIKVKTQKLEWKATSKVGSLDNVKHTPGGGSIKIFDEKYATTPSPATTPTPTPTSSKPVSLESANNGRQNGENSSRVSTPRSADVFDFTPRSSRPSTTSSAKTTSLPSAKPNSSPNETSVKSKNRRN